MREPASLVGFDVDLLPAIRGDVHLWRLLAKDPNDAFLLELAVRASADFLITYNTQDFPAAASFGINLATPKEFLEFLGDLP
jgi:predicted nucleic acid-binding protein